MGSFGNKGWSQVRIHSQTTLHRNSTYKCKCPKRSYFTVGGRKITAKRCNRTCPSRKYEDRFLFNIFSSPKENRRLETNHKLETSKQVSKEAAFQDGLFKQSYKPSTTGRLGNFNRSSRRLPSYSNSCEIQEISKVLHSRKGIPIHFHVLRSNGSAQNVHEINIGNCSSSKNAECPSGSLPGRLVLGKSVETSTSARQRENTQSSCQSRSNNQIGKINLNSKPESHIYRGSVSVGQRNCLSNIRKNSENRSSYFIDNTGTNSTQFSPSSGLNGFLYRTGPKCTAVHETNSAAFTAFLETSDKGSPSNNTNNSAFDRSFTVVESQRKSLERKNFQSKNKHKNSYDRRIQAGIRRSFRQPHLSRVLVRKRKEIAYKPSRTQSSSFVDSEISAPLERSESFDTVRLHNSCPVSQQAGRDSVSTVMSANLGIVSVNNQKRNNLESSPHNRQPKFPSRQSVESKNTSNRVDIKRFSDSENLSNLGQANDRSFCLRRKPQSRNFLLMDSQPISMGSRRSVSVLAKPRCVRFSSNSIDSESVTAHEEVSLPVNPDCSSVAKETLVHGPSSNAGSTSDEASHDSGSFVSTQNNDCTSKPTSIQSGCMAAINKSFKNKGFSSKTRKLMAASWRKGTQKDYAAKFRKFSSWCSEREIDPHTATLAQCADFLTSLFQSGLKYRTIAGYRSMLSAILPPADGVSIGQHPDIIRLLKGVFNKRPPEKRLVPEWDLRKVLDFLTSKTFEPISKISLKYLTLKSVFLAAISTFRRCSDLQALKINQGFMSIVQEGIVFVRDGLCKQDRPGHIGKQIFIPCFKKNIKLDPKRAIQTYIKRTEEFRNGENRLFLSFNKPHKAVSCQTISSWIVSVIKQAYEEQSDLKVKAHSTRAIGPSWALVKGASLNSILEAADWSRDTTFKKFYYRQIDSQEWELC